ARARTGGKKTDVIGYLEQAGRDCGERTVREDHGIMRGKGLELVWRGLELHLGQRRDAIGEALGKADGGVQPGADRGPALRQFHQPRQGLLDALYAVLDLFGVAGEFLAEGEG